MRCKNTGNPKDKKWNDLQWRWKIDTLMIFWMETWVCASVCFRHIRPLTARTMKPLFLVRDVLVFNSVLLFSFMLSINECTVILKVSKLMDRVINVNSNSFAMNIMSRLFVCPCEHKHTQTDPIRYDLFFL